MGLRRARGYGRESGVAGDGGAFSEFWGAPAEGGIRKTARARRYERERIANHAGEE